jgi:hypothetical protein
VVGWDACSGNVGRHNENWCGGCDPAIPILLKNLAIFLLARPCSALGRSSQKQVTDALLAELEPGFVSATDPVKGITLHYDRGGTGPVVMLLHAFPEDWYEYYKRK